MSHLQVCAEELRRFQVFSARDTYRVCSSVNIREELQDFGSALESFADRRISTSIELLNRAERGGHDSDECAAYRWSCWMLAGCFEEAWRESERIAARGRPDPNRLWDGLPFTGKRVLIRCLHGYGDAIQFIRYARLVKRDAARVVAQTHPELVALLRGAQCVDEVITWPQDPEDDARIWDQQIEVMELPRAFRTSLETVPRDVPYICVPDEKRHRCRVAFPTGERPRVGLQWGSSAWNHDRSMNLEELRPILDVPGLEFYSFQREAPREQLDFIKFKHPILDVAGDSPAIIEAAADLMNIDLLITVDTMLAHLAGALGKRVWTLLPFEADWRWMLEREDTPWYPTMRLFRQPSRGDWRSAVRRVASELARNRNLIALS